MQTPTRQSNRGAAERVWMCSWTSLLPHGTVHHQSRRIPSRGRLKITIAPQAIARHLQAACRACGAGRELTWLGYLPPGLFDGRHSLTVELSTVAARFRTHEEVTASSSRPRQVMRASQRGSGVRRSGEGAGRRTLKAATGASRRVCGSSSTPTSGSPSRRSSTCPSGRWRSSCSPRTCSSTSCPLGLHGEPRAHALGLGGLPRALATLIGSSLSDAFAVASWADLGRPDFDSQAAPCGDARAATSSQSLAAIPARPLWTHSGDTLQLAVMQPAPRCFSPWLAAVTRAARPQR